MTIELPKESLLAEKELGHSESEVRVRMLTSLHARECLLRLSVDGQLLPGVKAKTMEFEGTPRPRAVELKAYAATELPSKFQESVRAQSSFATMPTDQTVPHLADPTVSMADFLASNSPSVSLTPDIAPAPAAPPSRHPTLIDFLANQSANLDTKEEK